MIEEENYEDGYDAFEDKILEKLAEEQEEITTLEYQQKMIEEIAKLFSNKK